MTGPDEAIKKVLEGLRDAAAPAGIESRILEALGDHAPARGRGGWRGWMPAWLMGLMHQGAGRSIAWGVALAGVLMVALIVPAVHRSRHMATQSGRRSAPAALPSPAVSGTAVREAQLGAPGGPRPRLRANVRRAEVVRAGGSAALQDTRAVSYPAPPMPLTEQEKLLLRVAHKGDPVELAMLNPEIRARQETQSEDEFKEFFPPPPPIKETADDHL